MWHRQLTQNNQMQRSEYKIQLLEIQGYLFLIALRKKKKSISHSACNIMLEKSETGVRATAEVKASFGYLKLDLIK